VGTGGFALPPDPPEPVVDLTTALRARCSGPPWFNPTGAPVDADTLWRICRYALDPPPSDVSSPGGALVGLVVAAHRVSDVSPGAYLVAAGGAGRTVAGGRAERIAAGAVVPRLAATVPADVSPINFATANAVVSVVADPAAAGRWLGERALRVLNVEAGAVAQRVCVLAGAAGLVARPYNSYRARDVEQLLGLRGTGLTPLFQIAIGRPRTTPTWHLSLSL
jgi:nitroreductase